MRGVVYYNLNFATLQLGTAVLDCGIAATAHPPGSRHHELFCQTCTIKYCSAYIYERAFSAKHRYSLYNFLSHW